MTEPLDSLPTWVLSSAATRAHQILRARLADAGFTGYAYRCLLILADGAVRSQAHVGADAALDPRDVTHTIRGLEDRGLVARAPDPAHGRRILVSLTAAGSRAVDELRPVMAAIQDEVFGRLTDAERATLSDLLARVGAPS